MRQVLRFAALAIMGFLVLPLFAADEKKPDEKKDVDKKAPEMVAAGAVAGKILHVDESKRSIKLQISVPEINPDAARGLAQAQATLQQASLDRNPQSRQQKINQAQQQMAQHQRNLYREKKHDVDVNSTEDVKVRMANPPPKFDEKGKIVKHTAEELKELKGDDPKAIGYKAEFGDLRANQIVQVQLVKKKGTPTLPKPNPGEKGNKDVDKASITDAIAEYAPQAAVIVVIAEPPPG